jgi:hypothetical protein
VNGESNCGEVRLFANDKTAEDEKDFREAKRGACPVCYDGVVDGVPLGCGEEDPEGEAEGDDDGLGEGLEDGEGFDSISSHVQSSPL